MRNEDGVGMGLLLETGFVEGSESGESADARQSVDDLSGLYTTFGGFLVH